MARFPQRSASPDAVRRLCGALLSLCSPFSTMRCPPFLCSPSRVRRGTRQRRDRRDDAGMGKGERAYLVTYGEAVLRGERQSGSRAAADGVRGGVSC